MKEVEVKVKIDSSDEVIKKLKALGCQMSEVKTQTDMIFVPENITVLPTGPGVPVLRIREQEGKFILTMKISLTNGLDKRESETEILDPKAMEEIILSVGFKKMVTFSKQRRKTRYQNWEICVDEVPGLGSFMESEELTEDGDSSVIQEKMFEFLKTLGATEANRQSYGYDVIMWKQSQL
jgi:adenylate cyclase class 2